VLKKRYKILARLGSGGMSDVYLATDIYLEKTGSKDCRVAIKVLRSELTQDFNSVSLLAREAAKCKQLAHPHIIRVYDLEYDCNIWFMVMELLDGEPLSRLIQRSRPRGLPWRGARELLRQLSDALAYSHSKGIIHADLKPSNIFVTQQGLVKILDFGVAQALKSDHPVDFLHGGPPGADETTLYGYTPAYASPSLFSGNEPTPADDWYGLACIAYELLSSAHPFDRKRPEDAERKSLRLKKPGNCPSRLWTLLNQVLRAGADKATAATFSQLLVPASPLLKIYPLVLGALLVAGGAGALYHVRTVAALELMLAARSSYADVRQRIATMTPLQILAEIERHDEPLRSALILQQQQKLAEYFQHQAQQALRVPAVSDLLEIPDYPAALQTLEPALVLLPFNNSLLQTREQLLQQREHLQLSLSTELTTRLQQGNFRAEAARLLQLRAALSRLQVALPAVDAAVTESFVRAVTASAAAHQAQDLAVLTDLGRAVFTADPRVQETLAGLEQVASAGKILADYEAARARGEQPEFPMAAAELFYAEQFARWRQQIAGARESSELEPVYEQLTAVSQTLPATMPVLRELRRELANAYVRMSDRLLEQRAFTRAKLLLRRINELMDAS
jgi:serine/threonine protein kinase